MSDIIERHRRGAEQTLGAYCLPGPEMIALLDEIERLTHTLKAAQEGLEEYGDEMVETRAEIERLQAQLKQETADKLIANMKLIELEAEIERLRAYVKHERSLGAEGPMIELTDAKQKIERLQAQVAEGWPRLTEEIAQRDIEIERLKALIRGVDRGSATASP
jgi:chromosome segregation ATPase